jgi:hypothetical protein
MFAEVRPTRPPAITPARIAETRQVFEEALACTVADRSVFLLQRCVHDAALLRDVVSLLEADARVRDAAFFEEVIGAAVRELRSTDAAALDHPVLE